MVKRNRDDDDDDDDDDDEDEYDDEYDDDDETENIDNEEPELNLNAFDHYYSPPPTEDVMTPRKAWKIIQKKQNDAIRLNKRMREFDKVPTMKQITKRRRKKGGTRKMRKTGKARKMKTKKSSKSNTRKSTRRRHKNRRTR